MTISRRVADTTNSTVIVDTEAEQQRDSGIPCRNTLHPGESVCRTQNYASKFESARALTTEKQKQKK